MVRHLHVARVDDVLHQRRRVVRQDANNIPKLHRVSILILVRDSRWRGLRCRRRVPEKDPEQVRNLGRRVGTGDIGTGGESARLSRGALGDAYARATEVELQALYNTTKHNKTKQNAKNTRKDCAQPTSGRARSVEHVETTETVS